jgi:argininosuccinate synthase
VIAQRIAEIALKEGADAIAHGCTGKGNDQVRFELTIKHFAPNMKVIAPWREWDLKSREDEINYAEAHNIPLKISRETNYSKDKNLWHLSHEGLDLEDPGWRAALSEGRLPRNERLPGARAGQTHLCDHRV